MWIARNLAVLGSIGFLVCAAWRAVDHWQGQAFPETIFMVAMFVLAGCILHAGRDPGATAPRRRMRIVLLFCPALLFMLGVGGLEQRLASRGQAGLVSDVGALMAGAGAVVMCVSARRRRGAVVPGRA